MTKTPYLEQQAEAKLSSSLPAYGVPSEQHLEHCSVPQDRMVSLSAPPCDLPPDFTPELVSCVWLLLAVSPIP